MLKQQFKFFKKLIISPTLTAKYTEKVSTKANLIK